MDIVPLRLTEGMELRVLVEGGARRHGMCGGVDSVRKMLLRGPCIRRMRMLVHRHMLSRRLMSDAGGLWRRIVGDVLEVGPHVLAPLLAQLSGGIHRYLEQYPDEGGHWVGKNYVFDRRFAHGAAKHDVVSRCGICSIPWDRYQAGAKCPSCSMEVLVCRTCQRAKKASPKCHLCT